MLRHDYDHNIASWIGLPLGVLAGVLAGEAAFLMAEHSTDAHYFVETFAIVLRAFYVLAMVVMGSMMFDKMQTRHGQIAYLTLPATAFEKYLVNWLETVVATFGAFVVGMVAADAVRVAFSIMLGSDPQFCVSAASVCQRRAAMDGSSRVASVGDDDSQRVVAPQDDGQGHCAPCRRGCPGIFSDHIAAIESFHHKSFDDALNRGQLCDSLQNFCQNSNQINNYDNYNKQIQRAAPVDCG